MDTDYYLSRIGSFIQDIRIEEPTTGAFVSLICALILLIFSAFASASEIAFFSMSPTDLKTIANNGHPSDHFIRRLLERSEKLLATILITNNFVNVTIIMLLNYFFIKVVVISSGVAEFIIMTVTLTFLLLLFGEVMPKLYSAHYSLKFARMAAPMWGILEKVFSPVSYLLVRSTGFVDRRFARKNYALSMDELSQALNLTDKEDLKEEDRILKGIIRFGDETAKEVMTTRVDVVSIDVKSDFHSVIKIVVDNVYSRMPVWSGSLDKIVGVLYIKDLLPHLNKPESFRWQSLVRPAYFVPETKMIDDLLREFQDHKVHIAIVVDEYGGTSGIITMEDIIEEIVGEIRDEYDDEEKTHVQLDEHTYIFEGKTLLTDFCKITKLENELFEPVQGEADTVAGLLLELKGEFPKPHEIIEYGNCIFEILGMDARRISKVKLTIRTP